MVARTACSLVMSGEALAEVVLLAFCATLIGFTKAGWGMVLGTIPTVLLLAVYSPQDALVLQLPLLVIGDFLGVALFWKKWSWPDVRRLLPIAVLVTVLTSYLVSVVPSGILRQLIGVSTVLFAVLAAYARKKKVDQRPPRWPNTYSVVLTSLLTGLLSGAAHAGGPPVTLYLLKRQFSVVTLAATYTLLFSVLNAVKIPAYLSTGLLTWESFLAVLWALPFVPLGLFLGRIVLKRTSTERFTLLTVMFLFFSGALLVFTP